MNRNTPTHELQLELDLPREPEAVQAELFDFPGTYRCVRGKLQFIPAESARVGVRDAGSAVQFSDHPEIQIAHDPRAGAIFQPIPRGVPGARFEDYAGGKVVAS